MATTASRIADGELQTDVDQPTGSRETADLAAALELMLARLRSTIDDHKNAARSAGEARDAMQRFLAEALGGRLDVGATCRTSCGPRSPP